MEAEPMKPRVHLHMSLYYNLELGVGVAAIPSRPDLGANPHPQEAMRALGITYERCQPRPIADSWSFYNCANVPDDLPSWLYREEGE